MTAQPANLAETLLEKLQVLSPEKQQQLLTFAEFLIYQQTQLSIGEEQTPVSQAKQSPRIPGLHAGQVWMSEDFDDPLPDEFWLGENDPLTMTDEQIQQLNQRSSAS